MTIVGRIDALNDKHVIEFKVVDSIPRNPYRSHVMQVNLYMLVSKVRTSFIVYISRRDGRIKVYRVRCDKKNVRDAVKRAYTLYLALRNKGAPPPERGNFCNSCPYVLSCSTK
jgi:CRISPR/Cas system-associated exonuclease Cas4 (RecB family)